MAPMKTTDRRRIAAASLVLCAGGGAALLGLGRPSHASNRRALPAMTEGPFYPPARWRDGRGSDWDYDLTRVAGPQGRVRTAEGEALGLELAVLDTAGRAVDGCEVEIWQCDARAVYHHPAVPMPPGRFDEGFQGFGAAKADAAGALRFRTIRPVPYPGRTPHIHVKLRHPAFGERTSQLFVAGDPGNAGDFLWRRLGDDERAALAMTLQRAPAGSGLAWTARHTLVVPA